MVDFAKERLEELQRHLDEQHGLSERPGIQIQGRERHVVFISIGNPGMRARVFKRIAGTYQEAQQAARRAALRFIRKYRVDPYWIKMDVVTAVTEMDFPALERKAAITRRNYFRRGIAFDPDFKLAFLEQEINGNAMIRSVKNGTPRLDERNINHYIRYNQPNGFPFIKRRYQNKSAYVFETIGVFTGRDEDGLRDLYGGELTNGIRKTANIEDEVRSLIARSTNYLVNQVGSSGRFAYGYFSAFGRPIRTYNILRHSSSAYSMIEGYEILRDPAILEAAVKAIDYVIREAMVYRESGEAFVVDHANDSEIKLGSNATAILAMAKHMEVTGSDTYLAPARALARGIIKMKSAGGGFTHVLSHPSFDVKEAFRTVYYDGEALFALLRLYAVDREQKWLDEAREAFDYFIAEDYWKNHDHWLSYASNEITDYIPDDRYFTFGLKNCQGRLRFIYHRETTYPTFLELTMATYKMIKKIKELNKTYLLEHIDEEFLHETVDRRAEYQRVGFFYPELAMYNKNPGLILHGFFVRHHALRVRIDDVEHYLSGYCQYLLHRVPDLKDPARFRPMLDDI